ncbi:MAG: T9SS type A sorting domain-containing protein, partial [Phaeodactylibacter sp.]|nr:T9SS type A sorting domain-containing protein [Phaeodactylibacter sp.]
GIYANNLTPNSGSFVVNNNRFKACNIGLFTRSTSDFFFEDNGLYVSLADGCEENEYIHEAVGVTLSGTTAGFTFRGNYFHYDEATMPEDSLIGVECINLSEGLNNQIKGNTYENMFTAHRAIGNNGYFEDGLVYLCDSMAISYSAIPEEIEIKDFFVRQGGTIRQNQQDDNTLDAPLPTGNIFSGIGGYSFYNPDTSQIINYLYYGGSAQQDPASADLGYIGILPEAANEGNANCFTQVEPCTPPCDKEDIDEVKEDFHDTKALWEEQKEAYPLIEDEEEQQIALDSIIRLRRAMNQQARLILMTYSLDTAAIQTDSILAWLALAETYPTDYRLARHYFFTGEFDKHDTLWAAIPNRYGLNETQLAELDEIETVLNSIRPDLVTGIPLSRLPEAVLDSLMYWKDTCTEPGALAQAVLWRNGRRIIPDCSGEAPASRPGSGQQFSSTQAEAVSLSPIKLYPNPSQGILTIELPASYAPATALVYNLQGKMLLKQSLLGETNRINLFDFHSGLYIVEVTPSSGKRERFKLILAQ